MTELMMDWDEPDWVAPDGTRWCYEAEAEVWLGGRQEDALRIHSLEKFELHFPDGPCIDAITRRPVLRAARG